MPNPTELDRLCAIKQKQKDEQQKQRDEKQKQEDEKQKQEDENKRKQQIRQQQQKESKRRKIAEECEKFSQSIVEVEEILSSANRSEPKLSELFKKAKKIFPEASSERRGELKMVIQWAKNTLNGKAPEKEVEECVLREMDKECILDETVYRIMIGIGLIVLGIALGVGVGYLAASVFPWLALFELNYGTMFIGMLTIALFSLPILSIYGGLGVLFSSPSLGKEVKQFGTFFQAPVSSTDHPPPPEEKELVVNSSSVM